MLALSQTAQASELQKPGFAENIVSKFQTMELQNISRYINHYYK